MEQAFKCWVSSFHKRLRAKQSRDELGHGPLGPLGHLRATEANQTLADHSSVDPGGGVGVGVGVRCHGDGSAPVQELVQERPQVQGALPEWKVGNSEGIHAGS